MFLGTCMAASCMGYYISTHSASFLARSNISLHCSVWLGSWYPSHMSMIHGIPMATIKTFILVDILINFTFLVWLRSWKLISLLEHLVEHHVSTRITPHRNIDPRNSLPAKARKFIPRNLVRVRYISSCYMDNTIFSNIFHFFLWNL